LVLFLRRFATTQAAYRPAAQKARCSLTAEQQRCEDKETGKSYRRKKAKLFFERGKRRFPLSFFQGCIKRKKVKKQRNGKCSATLSDEAGKSVSFFLLSSAGRRRRKSDAGKSAHRNCAWTFGHALSCKFSRFFFRGQSKKSQVFIPLFKALSIQLFNFR
jgi:hypothetical protein